jgi:hypothetical protein
MYAIFPHMRRLFTVTTLFNASFADRTAREFKPGQNVFCDLEQHGDRLTLEHDNQDWFVDRQTFEESCVLTTATSAKPSL